VKQNKKAKTKEERKKESKQARKKARKQARKKARRQTSENTTPNPKSCSRNRLRMKSCGVSIKSRAIACRRKNRHISHMRKAGADVRTRCGSRGRRSKSADKVRACRAMAEKKEKKE
jgi:hypothetical protein